MVALRISAALLFVIAIFSGKMAIEELARVQIVELLRARSAPVDDDTRLHAALRDLVDFSEGMADALGATDAARETLAKRDGVGEAARPEAAWARVVRTSFVRSVLTWHDLRPFALFALFVLPPAGLMAAEVGLLGNPFRMGHAATWITHLGACLMLDLVGYGSLALTLMIGTNPWIFTPIELVAAPLLWMLASAAVLLHVDRNAPVWNSSATRLLVTSASIVACQVLTWTDPLAGLR